VNKTVKELENAQMKTDIPDFRPGDTVNVAVRIVEGEKERIQHFEGVCIRRKGSGLSETFTVRRLSYGVGMERIFPLHSPRVESIKVVRQGKVRRAKLYYLRERRGKKARISERRRVIEEVARAQKSPDIVESTSEENEEPSGEESHKKDVNNKAGAQIREQ